MDYIKEIKLKMDKNIQLIEKMEKSFERWKVIDGYPNYSVSSFGNVRNDKSGRILAFKNDGHGYLFVTLQKKNHKIHRLVANAYINNPDNKPFVDHKDNNKSNNNISNLRFATNKENCQNASIGKRNTSGVKGVHWNKKYKKWQANIRIDGILIFLGYFQYIEDAKQARIKKANEVFGEFTNVCEN